MITAPPEHATVTAHRSPDSAFIARDASSDVISTPVRLGVIEVALRHGQFVQIRPQGDHTELMQGMIASVALTNLGVTLRMALACLRAPGDAGHQKSAAVWARAEALHAILAPVLLHSRVRSTP